MRWPRRKFDPQQTSAQILLGILVSVMIACQAKTRAAQPIRLRDSAGVAFFEAPADGRAQRTWTLGQTPEILVGGAQDRELLDRVRRGGLFAGGSFVIANEGSHQLLFYSANGVRERAVGREGAGPREFRSFDFLEVIGDTVWVGDRANLRVSVLDDEGKFVRFIPLSLLSEEGLVHPVGAFEDGSLLLSISEPRPIEPGLSAAYRHLFVLQGDSTITDLGRVFRGESFRIMLRGTVADVGRPFAREGLIAVRGDEWFYSGGKEYRVERHAIGGKLLGVYSFPTEPPAVTRQELDRYLDYISTNYGAARAELFRRAPAPERLPAYTALMIDRDGNVWAAPHRGAKPSTCWHVFRRRPPLFATVCFPDRFTPLDIAGSSALGVLRDENDVERIARYRIVKGPGRADP